MMRGFKFDILKMHLGCYLLMHKMKQRIKMKYFITNKACFLSNHVFKWKVNNFNPFFTFRDKIMILLNWCVWFHNMYTWICLVLFWDVKYLKVLPRGLKTKWVKKIFRVNGKMFFFLDFFINVFPNRKRTREEKKSSKNIRFSLFVRKRRIFLKLCASFFSVSHFFEK